MDLNALINEANDATEELEDQSEAKSGGGFERETPPAGPTPARLIGYVEVGKRKQKPYQGKEKPDAEEVRLYFELNGKKHQREIEVDGVKKVVTNILTVKLAKKLDQKAGFFKLFTKMRYGRDSIKHMSQMLGEGFLVTVVHNKSEGKDGKEVVYANLKTNDGEWMIGAPQYLTDPLDGDSWAPLPVPAVSQNIRLLLWDKPSKMQWDSLFIDGSRTVKDDKGVEREVSKNWLQEDIVENAVNFEGSPLQALIGGLGDLSLTPDAPGNGSAGAGKGASPGGTGSAGTAEAQKSAASTSQGSGEANPPAKGDKAPSGSADAAADPLAALGF